MKFEGIRKELSKLFPKVFQNSDSDEYQELKTLSFPKEFINMYSSKSPGQPLEVGKFRFLRIADLIDENLWEEPGETLYPMGFSIVGFSDTGDVFCLNMRERNSRGQNDVLLARRELEYTAGDFKKARTSMKFMGNSLEDFLSRGIVALKKCQAGKLEIKGK